MGLFNDANYNITKIRTQGGDIKELEINGHPVNVTIAVALKCFKYSSSYLYVSEIPEENKEDVKAYTGGAIDDVEADYNVLTKTDCWTFDSKYFGEDMAQLEGAPTCDPQAKAEKRREFAERLYSEGGPAVDLWKELFGEETAERMLLENIYAVK